MSAILIGSMYVTSYRAIPSQTKPRGYHWTSSGERTNTHGIAVSQDLQKKMVAF
jgi:hypothetical protein